MEGYGELTYINGDIHKGQFHKGKKHGLGIQYIKSTNEYTIGEWIRGLFNIGKQIRDKSGQGNWLVQNKSKIASFNSKEEMNHLCNIEIKGKLLQLTSLDKISLFKLYDLKDK